MFYSKIGFKKKGVGCLFLYSVVTFGLIVLVTFTADVFNCNSNLKPAIQPEITKEAYHGERTCSSGDCQRKSGKRYKIGWIQYPMHIMLRPDAMFSGFDGCPYSNCEMTYIQEEAAECDALIFTARIFPKKLHFVRPHGQIWIFYEHEPPFRYNEQSNSWNLNKTFNWTMHYDAEIADIHIPYGQIVKRAKPVRKNLEQIMKRKNKTALMIMSHCDTPAERMKYIEELSKHVDVDLLGKCGMTWDCGQRFLHNDCFEIMNNYKFFLAFENSFCSNYFTEKIFDNYDYDTILVSRGGKKGQLLKIVPEGTIVSANDFKNAEELGVFLKSMTKQTYMNMLKKKMQYTSPDTYTPLFHDALCQLCERMNNREKFGKIIDDINDLIFSSEPCVPPSDLE